jgi:endonuclease/exonuclease/phosphatase family metal-dependent hydrolase
MSLRLATWNVQWCCGLDGAVDVERIAAQLRSLGDLDVCCLQELAVNYPALRGAPSHDQPTLLRGLLPAGWQLYFGAAVDEFDADGRRQRFGNAIATRLPVVQLRSHALPWPAEDGVKSMPRLALEVTLQATIGGSSRWLRVTSTHLEYYSKRQRMAQAEALRDLHFEACGRVNAPPRADDDGSPFRGKPQTASALVCGDFNFSPADPEYRAIQQGGALCDAWPIVHGAEPHAPTFQLHDQTYGETPIACDFVMVSRDLLPHVRHIEVDALTRASDHQPVVVELG